MSEPNDDAAAVPDDEASVPSGSQRPTGGPQDRPGATGANQPGGIPDLEPLVRELFGPDATLPPELTELLGALRADPTGSPLAGMLQAQFRSLFAPASTADRVATATDLARKVVAAKGDPSVGPVQRRAVEEAVAVARLWLDPVTALDSPTGPALALSGAEWVQATTPRWYVQGLFS